MYSNGPKIVTDGLMLCLDAGNPKSYPGSGTTWTDLSRNNRNGTLTNGPTFNSLNGGSIVLDQSNDYIQCGGSSIVTSSATFIVWMRRNGDQGSNAGILLSRGTTTTGLTFSTYGGNKFAYTWNDNSAYYNWDSGLVIPNATWCMCVASLGASNGVLYILRETGIFSSTNNVGHGSTTIDDIKIGWDEASPARYIGANIAAVQIYNRALSSTEILQNYNATKGRFKL